MRRRRTRVCLVLLVGALLGGWVALRDSSLVAVEQVEVHGATGPDAPRVEAALEREARTMTTLHAPEGDLREAVEGFPTVADVEVDRDLPHGLGVRVREHRTVGTVEADGRRAPVIEDGRVLRGANADAALPALDSTRPELVALAAAAPDPLRRRSARAYVRPSGVAIDLRTGPTVVFGPAERLEQKWAAASSVLADPASAGARYVDVRLPERPVAGGVLTLDSSLSPAEPTEAPAELEPEP